MVKRRYCQYSFEDTQRALQQQQQQLQVEIVRHSASKNGRRILLASEKHGRALVTVILARSSDWYRYHLNTYMHGMECAVVGTHDSCLSVPVLSMDDLQWYEPFELRLSLAPAKDLKLPERPDRFERRYRKTHYGHCVLVGALICGRQDAVDRLMTLPPSTRFRIEAEVRRLRERRRGRPLKLWDDPYQGHLPTSPLLGESAS